MTSPVERAAALDRADPLAAYLDRFVVADPDLVYLDGNSLGRLPLMTVERLHQVVVDEWGGGLVRTWDQWIDDALRVGDLIGTGLLGARSGETVVADSTTVNLFKLLSAAVGARSGGIVIDAHEFPTDRYVAASVAAGHGRTLVALDTDVVEGPSVDDVAEAVAGGDVACVLLSAVHYRSGALADMAGITAAAHDCGALVLWDCSHAVGSVVLDLHDVRADLAVGCTYKHCHGGPGAPAFLWVREDLQRSIRQPIWGWFGQAEQFAMGPDYDPVVGIGAFTSGTPPILALAAVEEGIRLVVDAGIAAVQAKGASLTALAVDLHDALLAPFGCTLGTPRDPARRGGHVSVRHPDAAAVALALRDLGVVPDFRTPDSVRYGMAALTTTHADVAAGVERTAGVLEEGLHRRFQPGAVVAGRVRVT